MIHQEGPVIPVPGFRHPTVVPGGYTDVVENQCGISFGALAEPQVNGGEMTGGKFLVRPGEHDALVLYDVQEVTRVVLVAQGECASFMGLDERVLACKGNMGILIKQRIKDAGRGGGKVDDLIYVLRLEFHDAKVLP